MDFFEPPLDASVIERLSSGAPLDQLLPEQPDDRATAGQSRTLLDPDLVGTRWLFEAGPDAPRERVWVQADSAGHSTAIALAALGVLAGMYGSGTSRYRQLALARARFALAAPPSRPASGSAITSVPLFDCGEVSAGVTAGAGLARFAPTFVIHLQDWGAAGTPASVRIVESFMLEPEDHRRLANARWRRWGRPTREARLIDAHPDARVGRLASRYAGRMGVRLTDAIGGGEAPDRAAAIRLEAGRYLVQWPWRQVGGASFCELALSRTGAPGICVQAAGGTHAERAAALLAVAEGAVLHRLGLESQEVAR